MGIKSGRFTGRNGHEYEVQIFGTTVANDTVELSASPAYIGMAAGERKFVGYKSTTARVQILTDVPLVDLYAQSATSVRMQIWDMTDSRCEFDGYVTPFAFDQPYTGKLDAVTVNAVDKLTAMKDVKYTNVDEVQGDYGTDRMAIDIVQAIASRVGIERMVIHTNFDELSDGNNSPLNIPVAQAGFLQDGMTMLEVLSAICQFFGYTASYVGDTLYLWDENCFTHAAQGKNMNCNMYVDQGGFYWSRTGHYYDAQDSPLGEQNIATSELRNDISVTIERAYDGIQITPSGSDTSILLPDVCADENLRFIQSDDNTIGAYTRKTTLTDGGETYRTPMLSTLLYTGLGSTSTPDGFPENVDNYGDYMRPDDIVNGGTRPWNVGSIPMRYVRGKAEARDTGLNAYAPTVELEQMNLIWVRAVSEEGKYAFKQKEAYSHTYGYAAIELSVLTTEIESYKLLSHMDSGMFLPWVDVTAGGKHLGYGSATPYADESWGSTPNYHTAVQVDESGNLYASLRGADYWDYRKVFKVPNDGQVKINGYSHGVALLWNYFITKLRIVGVGDPINTEHKDMRHEYYSNPRELLAVSTNITTRVSGESDKIVDGHKPYGVNARPSVVPSEYWQGGYMGRADQEAIPISGILMEQLKTRYAQARPAYTMTADKDIKPYAPVWWNGRLYTVEAYERDLYNSTTNITID